MNTFFSGIVINLNVPQHMTDGIPRNISDPLLKIIVKYRNHPSIKALKRVPNSVYLFSFDILERKFSRKLVVWITQKHVKNQI